MGEKTQKQKATMFMKGWTLATGCQGVEPEDFKDEDFKAGYYEGRKIRSLQRVIVEDKYGITFDRIYAVNSEAEATELLTAEKERGDGTVHGREGS